MINYYQLPFWCKLLNFDTAQLTVNYLEYNLKYTPKNTKWFDTVIRLSDSIYMEQIFTQKELGEGGFSSATIGTWEGECWVWDLI